MTAHLCISVRFIDPSDRPSFHGRSDGGTPEWPPSPLRFFQALVAASAARFGNPDQFRDYAAPAFEWLAELHPPIVVAPEGITGTPFRTAVPNNDMDVVAWDWARGLEPHKQPAALKALKTVWPTYMVGGGEFPAVHYLWEVEDMDQAGLERHKAALFAAAGDLFALGWGTDMAVGQGRLLTSAEVSELKGQRWEPVGNEAVTRLRVPTPGTFDALVTRYGAFLSRIGEKGFVPVPLLTAFAVVGYRGANDPPTRRYAAFRLRHPVEDRSTLFATTRANSVAAMIRNSTARVAEDQKRPSEWIDRYVHGHREGADSALPRFSYLPLPSIERRGDSNLVVGAIRRVVVAEVIDSGQSQLPWVRQMLPGQFLTDEKTGDRKALLTPLTGGDWVLRQYIDPSATWATVTPIVLPGSDARARKRSGGRGGSSGSPGGKFTKAEKLFFKALGHAGYSPDALAELEFRNASFWPGCDWALSFQRPDYLKKGHWSVYHMHLRWKQPIKGPLAIGAGRHCGLGIFATRNM